MVVSGGIEPTSSGSQPGILSVELSDVLEWYGERDLNPQKTASEAVAFAISPPPHENQKKG